jgi:adenylate cyclase class 2
MEYEVKVLDIDINNIRKKLNSIGCKKIHNQKMFKRNVFSLCDKKINGFARVRDEGKNVTMTTKVFIDKDFPQETEITINEDFEKAIKFMESIGLKKKSFQESIREKYSHPLAHEITIDTIPGIPSYMEIDCSNKENLDKLIELLAIDKDKIRTGSFDKQYLEYYNISKEEFEKIKSLSFRNIKNEIFPKKNKELFNKVISLYNEKYLKKVEKK